ncbi:MAG: ribbon-helix-helix protein, CopG family [Methanocorpusculum sp.]|nr:ribbon-helix-helix protein, CopG family [Methanocorpusculum sp.]
MARKPVNTAQFSIRIPQQMKDKLQASAEKQGIDGVAWIRQAISEKLNREEQGHPDVSDNDLRETIREVVAEMLEERKGEKS